MTPNWPMPDGVRVPEHCHPRHSWRDLLEQLQPFGAHAVFESHEAGDVAARLRQAVDEAGADRIGDDHEDHRHVADRLQQGVATVAPVATMTSRASVANSAAYLRMCSTSPAAQRTSIRTLRPSVQPNFRSPCTNAAMRAFDSASSPAVLINTPIRRILSAAARAPQRPCRRTAQQRDELTPFHDCLLLPLLRH